MDLGPQTLVVWPLFHDTSSNTILHYIIMPILMPLQRLACDFTFRLFGEKLITLEQPLTVGTWTFGRTRPLGRGFPLVIVHFEQEGDAPSFSGAF